MKIISLIICFIITSIVVNNIEIVTTIDQHIIHTLQNSLDFVPLFIPELFDEVLYKIFLYIPILAIIFFLIKKKQYLYIFFISIMPLISRFINNIIKDIIQRPRPPYNCRILEDTLQYGFTTYSYTSNHSLTTFCVYGFIIYYLNKYCTNKIIKNIGISFSIIWIITIGISRIWLGVHNPTDVLCAYLLGTIIIYSAIKIIYFVENRNK